MPITNILVVKDKGESIEGMINRFELLVKKEGIISKIRQKEQYIKPSSKKHTRKSGDRFHRRDNQSK
jgi:ribosomal protein S21